MNEDYPGRSGSRLGRGSLGTGWKSRWGRVERRWCTGPGTSGWAGLVALKVLAPALAADEEFRRRFTAESRAAAAVDDPHIIPVYEAGEATGMLFIAMRLVTGGDLRRVLARDGPLPQERAAAFLSPVAFALDAAHRAGLVHRDVTPGNILVDAQPDRPEHVYLSDFGISKAIASTARLTDSGRFLGTPEYTSPEQAQGSAVRRAGRPVRAGVRSLAPADRHGAFPAGQRAGRAAGAPA